MRCVSCARALLGVGLVPLAMGMSVGVGIAGAASAQTAELLLEQGDTVVGLGGMTVLDALQINDGKTWIAKVLTSHHDPNQDSALLRSGFVTLREGMQLTSPPGAQLDEFGSIAINARGDIAMKATLRLPGVAQGQSAVLWNLKTIVKKGDLLVSPMVGANTDWDLFHFAKINAAGTLLALGVVRNPAVPTPKEDTLVKIQLDALGNVLGTTVVATRGQVVPALSEGVVGTLPSPESLYAMNARGDVIHFVITHAGSAVMLNMEQVLAREGQASPVGVSWSSLSASQVALNDRGEHALSGVLNGTTDLYLIQKNGAKFVRQGDLLPAMAPLEVGAGSSAPIHLANNGDLFWRMDIDGRVPPADDLDVDDAFMRNRAPLVRAGWTVAAGELVTKLDNTVSSFAISPNGRFFVGKVGIGDDKHPAAVFVDLGLVLELPGCQQRDGTLRVTSGEARVGERLVFTMHGGHVAGALSRINFSTRLRNPTSECGVITPFGESMISPAHRFASVFLGPWDGSAPCSGSVTIPSDLVLIDATLFAQGSFRRSGTRDVSLTNALRIEIGAP
jgi:hypothetical protein